MSKISITQEDNLSLLRRLETSSIDLIYSDVLYGTGRKFAEFTDIRATQSAVEEHYALRIKEMHRVLSDTGSIYIQCDTKINHWLRIIMDRVFGYEHFQNEICWVYRSAGFSRKKWSSKHDVILFYTKSNDFTFNLNAVREEEIAESTMRRWGKDIEEFGLIRNWKNGKLYWVNPYSPPRDWFDINTLPQAHSERLGYSTQKPTKLVSRILTASSNPGDLVADFYLGSGTTAKVALDLGRDFVGCDISPEAVRISKDRCGI